MGLSTLEKEAAACRKMWQSVLLRAWGDATGEFLVTHVSKKREDQIRGDAKKWLMEDSEDLRMVCDGAGVKWENVVKKSREEFGNGK